MTTGFDWTDHTVREALGIRSGTSPRNLQFTGVSTDTRTVEEGDLFVALHGERFDGHEFVTEAAAQGAQAAVVSRYVDTNDPIEFYLVADTLDGLADLARYRRRALSGQVIGITGSSGKTTVKELVTAALSSSFEVHSTHGNLNNRVGLPLSMLRAPPSTEFLVLEMGTSEPGEIGILTAIAEPDHTVVTTVSEAHLTGLGSLEGVLTEKLDLIRGMRLGGSIVVGDEPALLPSAAREIRPDICVTGLSDRADPEFRGISLSQDPDGGYRFLLGDREVKAGIPGLHGVRNLLLALACARLLGADEGTAIEQASAVKPGRLRGEVRPIGGLTMILDCYNANPQSVTAALEVLADLPGASRRIAVLGSMLELGERSRALHRTILAKARSLPLDLVVVLGEFASAATEFADQRRSGVSSDLELITASTLDDGYRALRSRLEGTETVLLKGSRGVALETLIDRFEEDFGRGPAERETLKKAGAGPGLGA